MKKRILSAISMLAMAGALTMPAVAQTASGAGMAKPAGAGKMGKMEREDREGREAHPMIRRAINALEKAKWDLNHASHDFGGHRADALKACDNAIEQLKLALQYDKK